MAAPIGQKSRLRGRLDEFAVRVLRIRARHVPREGLQLGKASRVDAGDIHGDVDGGAVAALGVAGQCVFEEEFAGGVFGEELRDDVAPVAVHVGELVEPEAHVEVPRVPPRAADVLLVVGLAVDVVVEGCAVGGEGLRVGVPGDDGVDVVAGEGLRYDVSVKAVEEVGGLVGEGWGRVGEISVLGEGDELVYVGHGGDEGHVEVALDCLDDVGQ